MRANSLLFAWTIVQGAKVVLVRKIISSAASSQRLHGQINPEGDKDIEVLVGERLRARGQTVERLRVVPEVPLPRR